MTRPFEESVKQMNNPSNRREERPGSWLSEKGLDPEKAVLWPYKRDYADSIYDEPEVEKLVGLWPGMTYPDREGGDIEIINSTTHEYGGDGFDLEYGWAIADDTVSTIEEMIEPEENLQQHEYTDRETDRCLDAAFSRLADTSDRLLKEENAAAVYNLESVARYELPRLDEDPEKNQLMYAQRIAEHLEDRGFCTEICEDVDFSREAHLIGRR